MVADRSGPHAVARHRAWLADLARKRGLERAAAAAAAAEFGELDARERGFHVHGGLGELAAGHGRPAAGRDGTGRRGAWAAPTPPRQRLRAPGAVPIVPVELANGTRQLSPQPLERPATMPHRGRPRSAEHGAGCATPSSPDDPAPPRHRQRRRWSRLPVQIVLFDGTVVLASPEGGALAAAGREP